MRVLEASGLRVEAELLEFGHDLPQLRCLRGREFVREREREMESEGQNLALTVL